LKVEEDKEKKNEKKRVLQLKKRILFKALYLAKRV
jgi:hypothetical protein